VSNRNLMAEPIEREQPCDLCLGKCFEIISRRDRRGNDLTTVVCTRCGLVSHLRIPTDEELADYYGKAYRRDYHGEIAPSARRVIRAWNTGQGIFRRVHTFLQPGDRVFEVGAGIGCTVKAFELAGFDASGIEPGEGFHAFSRRRLHARIENKMLGQVPRHRTLQFSRPRAAAYSRYSCARGAALRGLSESRRAACRTGKAVPLRPRVQLHASHIVDAGPGVWFSDPPAAIARRRPGSDDGVPADR